MKSYVLDSFAMIAYFEDEPGATKVSEILVIKRQPFNIE